MFPYRPVNSARISCVSSLKMILEWTCYIQNICRSASYAMYKIGRIRNYLWWKIYRNPHSCFYATCRMSINATAFCMAWPDSHIVKLQRIQNSAARLVTRTRFHDHITHVLQKLHWLPVRYHLVQNFDSDVQMYSWIGTTIFTRTHTGI